MFRKITSTINATVNEIKAGYNQLEIENLHVRQQRRREESLLQ